jgi:tetratricopeptide (TPR) repeat protein
MPSEKRLAMFEKYAAAADSRDDVKSREVVLMVETGKLDNAIAVLQKRHFHLWEGGVRFNASDSWTEAHLLRGRQRMTSKQYAAALDDFKVSLEYPSNLESTRSYRGSRMPESLYFQGLALDALSRSEEAKNAWKASAAQLLGTEDNPHPTVDTGAALLYYQGRSLERLGDTKRAKSIYSSLVNLGKDAAAPRPRSDFFAKFGERGSARMRSAQAHYLAGLGYLGLNETDPARAEFRKAVELNVYHLDARTQLRAIGN